MNKLFLSAVATTGLLSSALFSVVAQANERATYEGG